MDTVRLIYAYGSTDPTDNVLSSSDYHGATNRGSKSVYLLDPESPVTSIPNDAVTYDLVMDNVSIDQWGDRLYPLCVLVVDDEFPCFSILYHTVPIRRTIANSFLHLQ